MSDLITKTCDGIGCEAIKREANRWYVLLVRPEALVVATYEAFHETKEARKYARGSGVTRYDVCGSACLDKMLLKTLDEREREG